MSDKVELVLHHGGNFIKYPTMRYINGVVETIKIYPDEISYLHLLKFMMNGGYGKIKSLSYKIPQEPLEMLMVLWNDATTLHLIGLALKYRVCEIYVEHGIEDAEICTAPLYLPSPHINDKYANKDGDIPNTTTEDEVIELPVNVGVEVATEAEKSPNIEENELQVESEPNGSENEIEQQTDIEFEREIELESDHGSPFGDEEGVGGITQVENETQYWDKVGDETEDNYLIDLVFQTEAEGNHTHENIKVKDKSNNHTIVTKERKGSKRKGGLLLRDLDGEVESEYFDSDDMRSIESEREDNVGFEMQSKRHTSRWTSYNPDSETIDLKEGMLFEDKTQFKNAMMKYAVLNKRDIRFYTNDSKRVRMVCATGCPFLCYASWEEGLKCFQLKTLNLTYKCNPKFKLKVVSQKWLEDKLVEKIIED